MNDSTSKRTLLVLQSSSRTCQAQMKRMYRSSNGLSLLTEDMISKLIKGVAINFCDQACGNPLAIGISYSQLSRISSLRGTVSISTLSCQPETMAQARG